MRSTCQTTLSPFSRPVKTGSRPSIPALAQPAIAQPKQIATCRLEVHKSLVEHGVGDLHETGDIGAHYEIARLPILFGCPICLLMNGNHNIVQPLVHLFASP